MRRTRLVAIISAASAVIFSAFQAPEWLGYVALVLLGGALLLVVLEIPWIARRIKWEVRRKNPVGDVLALLHAQRVQFRKDLQAHLGSLNELGNRKDLKAADLRAYAHGLCQTLEKGHAPQLAKRLEVHLADDASPQVVEQRRHEMWMGLTRALLWDEFS